MSVMSFKPSSLTPEPTLLTPVLCSSKSPRKAVGQWQAQARDLGKVAKSRRPGNEEELLPEQRSPAESVLAPSWDLGGEGARLRSPTGYRSLRVSGGLVPVYCSMEGPQASSLQSQKHSLTKVSFLSSPLDPAWP